MIPIRVSSLYPYILKVFLYCIYIAFRIHVTIKILDNIWIFNEITVVMPFWFHLCPFCPRLMPFLFLLLYDLCHFVHGFSNNVITNTDYNNKLIFIIYLCHFYMRYNNYNTVIIITLYKRCKSYKALCTWTIKLYKRR